jgi:predicted permease
MTERILDPTPEVVLRPIVLASLAGSSWVVDLSLWLLIAAVLVLVISTANVANLLLARGVARRREFAMRLSLGAGGLRIARQQLTESIALAVFGAGAGFVVAYCGVALLRPFPLPPGAGRIDARLLGFSLALSLLTAIAFSVFPAWRSIQVDPVRVLKGSHASGALVRNPIRLTLVVLQVSLSFALLVGAALFVRSLGQVSAIRGGADLDHLLTVEVTLRADDAPQLSRSYAEFFQRASLRLSNVSGVESAATVFFPPFEGWGWSVNWRVPGQKEYWAGTTYLNVIGPEYFETAGTRLLRGRTILSTDQPGTEPVAVVNEAMALLLAKDGNPVGQCVDIRAPGLGRVPCLHIVGVAESQRNSYLDSEPVPTVFRAAAQVPQGIPYHSPMLLVRTTDDAAGRTAAVHAALQGLREDLPYVTVAPLTERLEELRPFQLGAMLFTLFAVLALLLAAVGLYAVLGYFVAERTSEVGVRRALGAPAVAVMRLVVWQSVVPVATGLAIGLLAALIGTRVLASYLYGVSPQDPVALTSAASCLIAVAAIATVLPVWRVLRIDPMVALRQD